MKKLHVWGTERLITSSDIWL